MRNRVQLAVMAMALSAATPACASETITYNVAGLLNGRFSLEESNGTYTLSSANLSLVGTSFTTGTTGFQMHGSEGGTLYALINGPSPVLPRTSDFMISFNYVGQTASSLTFTLPFSLDVNRSSVVAVTRLESAVPEPATWMLMLFGFGAVGCGIRRKDLQAGVAYT